jgi:L-ascorbate metabolism protein UlaG (beta-lactamase superfamily)
MATSGGTPAAAGSSSSALTVRLIGGPTALIGIAGLRLLTDPTFDPPGDHPVGSRTLVKTHGPAVAADALGPVDAVLLSHDQHPDNLDTAGRELLSRVPVVFSTTAAAGRLGGTVTALAPWQQATLTGPDGRLLQVTGVPAQHGPDGTEHLTGPVTGFVLAGEGVPAVYVSGDNASLAVVQAVADRCGPVDVALLFAGAALTPLLDAPLTLGSDQAAEAARILGARTVVPLHTEGWEHFTEGPATVTEAFARSGQQGQLILLAPGDAAELA